MSDKKSEKAHGEILDQIRADLGKYYRSKIRVSADSAKSIIEAISSEFKGYGKTLEVKLNDAVHEYSICNREGGSYKHMFSDYDITTELQNPITELPDVHVYKTDRFIVISYVPLDDLTDNLMDLGEIADISHPRNQLCKHCKTVSITIINKSVYE